MPNIVGKVYSFTFFMSALPGLSTSSFTNLMFTCNGTRVSDVVANSFAVVEVPITSGDMIGFYKASFTPDTPGYYVVAFTPAIPDSPTIVASTDILSASEDPTLTYVNLTQDTPEPNALVPALDNAQDYMLMVFTSSDWDVGLTDTIHAAAMTGLSSSGNWLSTPLVVTPGTYHIIARDNFGNTLVLAPYLTV